MTTTEPVYPAGTHKHGTVDMVDAYREVAKASERLDWTPLVLELADPWTFTCEDDRWLYRLEIDSWRREVMGDTAFQSTYLWVYAKADPEPRRVVHYYCDSTVRGGVISIMRWYSESHRDRQ